MHSRLTGSVASGSESASCIGLWCGGVMVVWGYGDVGWGYGSVGVVGCGGVMVVWGVVGL